MRLLRRFIREAVTVSPGYLAKERVRQALQDMIVDRVRSGDVASAEQLTETIASLEMSVNALKMVPFAAWQKLAGTSPAKK